MHEHRYSITAFAEEPALPPQQAQLLHEFSQFVCAANLSLHQATQSSTKHFCDSLIQYGVQLRQARPHGEFTDADLFPSLSIGRLRKKIIDDDAEKFGVRLRRFAENFAHLSIDAATVHGTSTLDIILLKTSPTESCTDFILFDSILIPDSSQQFYMETITDVIERLANRHIQVRSIVGDGLSSQRFGLSPTSATSIQNSPEFLARCPMIAPILYIYCNCHLVNLALHDALELSTFLGRCNRAVIAFSHLLRRRENVRVIKKRCPTFSPTRWCHAYLLCRFFAKHYQAILGLDISIPPEIFAFGVLIEPLFVLVSQFEDRKTRFYMRERLMAKFGARMRRLAVKYRHIVYIPICADLLQTIVFLRLSKENHHLSLMAEAFTCQSKLTRAENAEPTDEEPLFLDNIFEELINEEAVARAAAEEEPDDSWPTEEEDEEQEDPGVEFEPEALDFDPLEHERSITRLRTKLDAIQAQDGHLGIFDIGCNMIEEHARRSDWDEEKSQVCQRQWATWIAANVLDRRFHHVLELPPPLFWNVMGTSSDWQILAEYAAMVVSLPTAEAENERTFSIRKFVIGERGARSKNDLVVARIRTRLENSHPPIDV